MRVSKDNRNKLMSDFYCTNCGKKGIPILRKKGSERENGHLKKMFCIYCNQEENMVEIKPNGKYTVEDFKLEYQYGNFENGQRVITYKQFLTNLKTRSDVEC